MQAQESSNDSPGLEGTRPGTLFPIEAGRTGGQVSRWSHQEKAIQAWQREALALSWSPRTGKTHAIGGQVLKLEKLVYLRRTLVIAPQGVCQQVWPEEFEQDSRGHVIINLSAGPIKKRRAKIQELIALEKTRPRHDANYIVLVNWEGLVELTPDLLAWGPQLVVADEAHYAKSAGAARSRALHKFAKAPYRRTLTGTPTPRDYIDLFSQYKFLEPKLFGTNKAAFLKRYCELDMWGRVKFYRNLPELREKLATVTSYFDREKEWNDLPPLRVPRRIFLPGEARALYDDIVKKTVAEWQGVDIDATHKLAKIVKLQELTAGFIRGETGEVHWVHTAKIDAAVSEVVDLVKNGEKVVVFYHFTPEGEKLVEALDTAIGSPAVARIGSGVSPAARLDLQKRFQKKDDPLRVMVMQDSLGIGIKLSAASYMVRMSYPLDFAAYTQSNDRIYEPDKALTYIELEVDRSVDQFAKRICMDKKKATDELFGKGFEELVT